MLVEDLPALQTKCSNGSVFSSDSLAGFNCAHGGVTTFLNFQRANFRKIGILSEIPLDVTGNRKFVFHLVKHLQVTLLCRE